MNIILRFLFIFSIFLFIASPLATATSNIQLTLSPSSSYPGDLIELQAKRVHANFAEFEIKLPKHNALHLVSKQKIPVCYENGLYTQIITWTLQPTQAGSIEINDIKAILKQGNLETEYTLPSQTLTVQSYAINEDSLTPEPITLTQSTSTPPFWLFAIIALGIILLIAIKIKLSPKGIHTSPQSEPPSLDTLHNELEQGILPIQLIEKLLNQNPSPLSSKLRTALEQAAYGKSSTAKSLLAKIKEGGLK